MNWAAIGNMDLSGGGFMLLTLFLFDFFALCLPRKVQLSVVTVPSDIDCLDSYRQK